MLFSLLSQYPLQDFKALYKFCIIIIIIINEWHMWRYELHLPHLINAATLPCESRKPKMDVNTTSALMITTK